MAAEAILPILRHSNTVNDTAFEVHCQRCDSMFVFDIDRFIPLNCLFNPYPNQQIVIKVCPYCGAMEEENVYSLERKFINLRITSM